MSNPAGRGMVGHQHALAGGAQVNGDSHLLQGDEHWQADIAVLSEMTSLIAQLSTYVLRYLDADAGRVEPISVADERALGERVTALGAGLQARAERREALADRPLEIEGRVALPPATEDH